MNELTIFLNANHFRTKNQFCKVMAQECGFPNYFGGGIDAMNDCMRDLSWYNEYKITLQIKNLKQLNVKNLTLYQFVQEIIEGWQKYWQSNPEKQVIVEIV